MGVVGDDVPQLRARRLPFLAGGLQFRQLDFGFCQFAGYVIITPDILSCFMIWSTQLPCW